MEIEEAINRLKIIKEINKEIENVKFNLLNKEEVNDRLLDISKDKIKNILDKYKIIKSNEESAINMYHEFKELLEEE